MSYIHAIPRIQPQEVACDMLHESPPDSSWLPQPAEAQELAGTFDQLRVLVKPGDTLTVVDDAGQRVRGKVVSLSNSVLNLTVSGTPRQFLSTDVNTIEKRGADSLKNGALIGLAVGGGIGAAGNARLGRYIRRQCRPASWLWVS